ncbi:MAG: NAD-dependent epimerase/dehydratase family protein [Cyclobacteriaceae bacterium]
MEQIKVIITGTTGMVGEGVLLECLSSSQVSGVLSVSRKPQGMSHPKLKEYVVRDFLDLDKGDNMLNGYDACFFCAGVSSIGMSEADYTRITYGTTIHFAKILAAQNPGMTFVYVSGAGTDSTEKGRSMWARVKGRTENALLKMRFKRAHNFRPGFMKAVPGQRYTLTMYKYMAWMFPVLKLMSPNSASTLSQVAQAMIKCATTDVDKPIMEVSDINRLAPAD